MRCSAAILALALAAYALPACGPPPPPAREFIVEYQAHGPVIEGDALWFTVVRSQGAHNSRVFAVRCLRSAMSAAAPECEWHELAEREPESTSPRALARRTAAIEHECALDGVTVRSEHAEGFWLAVCGTDRFYRLEGSAYVEQPNAP